MTKISSGSKVINDLLNGGFEEGVISTIFGRAGTGKTNIALMTAINATSKGKTVIFIDTEGGFSPERCSQLCPNSKLLNNIKIKNPSAFDEQKKDIRNLRELVKNKEVDLIIIDSLTMLYRLERPEDPTEINLELTKQLSILSSLARKNNLPIVITNQVYSDFDKRDNVKMVGGDILKYWSKCLIKLERLTNYVRKAELVKHRSLPEGKAVFFEITMDGLKEVEKPKDKEKRFSLF